MTGVRIGIVLQGISATVTALVIAFIAGWKLTLVVLCFFPLLLFSGKMQGRKQGNAGKSKDQSSYSEQGSQVFRS